MKVSDYEVFIAYSGADEDLKDVVVSALKKQINQDLIFAFRDAPFGEDWLERNTQAAAKARVLVVLLTPNSIYSPWIHYEIGANRVAGLQSPRDTGHQRSKTAPTIVMALAKGLGPGDLPPDVADFYRLIRVDFKQLDTNTSVKKFLTSIGEALDTEHSWRSSTLASIVRVAKGVGGWSVTSQCAHATPISRSPFTFMTHLEATTTRHIVDFSQNLHFLFGKETAAADRRKALLKQLRRKGGPTVEIIICDKDYPEFRQSWNELMGSSYEEHLDNATGNLVKFWERYANDCKKTSKPKIYLLSTMMIMLHSRFSPLKPPTQLNQAISMQNYKPSLTADQSPNTRHKGAKINGFLFSCSYFP